MGSLRVILELSQISQYYEYIRADDGNQPNDAENLLPDLPSLAVFQPFQKDVSKCGGVSIEAVDQLLMVGICSKPQLKGVGKKDQAKKQEQ
ncbi:MAG: hypothetical protein KAX86_00840 [Anaerolineales bacterium]|nr:hypothetical protein [Anaerolineales bacterium]